MREKLTDKNQSELGALKKEVEVEENIFALN